MHLKQQLQQQHPANGIGASAQPVTAVSMNASPVTLIRSPSMLLIAETPGANELASYANQTGARLLGTVNIGQATDRLAQIVDVDVVLIDCRHDMHALTSLIARIDTLSLNTGTAAVYITSLNTLDKVEALITSSCAQILCQPEMGDLTIALSSALVQRNIGFSLHDTSRNDHSDHRLHAELKRLSGLIESLLYPVNTQDAQFPHSQVAPTPFSSLRSPNRTYTTSESPFQAGKPVPLTARHVRAVLRARRLRDELIASDLFADPAWDIMLDLMAARLEGMRVSVSSLCIAAAVPPTTALRWIRLLTDRGILERQADRDDARRIYIALSDKGAAAVDRWFATITPILSVAGQ